MTACRQAALQAADAFNKRLRASRGRDARCQERADFELIQAMPAIPRGQRCPRSTYGVRQTAKVDESAPESGGYGLDVAGRDRRGAGRDGRGGKP
jgi:hypothetical protein